MRIYNDQPLQSGDALSHIRYPNARSASDLTDYQVAERLLYIFAISGGLVNGDQVNSNVLCQVVNITAASTSGSARSLPPHTTGSWAVLVVALMAGVVIAVV